MLPLGQLTLGLGCSVSIHFKSNARAEICSRTGPSHRRAVPEVGESELSAGVIGCVLNVCKANNALESVEGDSGGPGGNWGSVSCCSELFRRVQSRGRACRVESQAGKQPATHPLHSLAACVDPWLMLHSFLPSTSPQQRALIHPQ